MEVVFLFFSFFTPHPEACKYAWVKSHRAEETKVWVAQPDHRWWVDVVGGWGNWVRAWNGVGRKEMGEGGGVCVKVVEAGDDVAGELCRRRGQAVRFAGGEEEVGGGEQGEER